MADDGSSFFRHPRTGEPKHADLLRMQEIVLQLDGQAVEAGRRLDDIVDDIVDPKSLAHMSMNRAMRVLGVERQADLLARMDEVAKLATVYHEAFIVGYRFHERGGRQ